MTRLHIKYAILTAAIFLPLIWAFVRIRNLYPIASWNVMVAGGLLERGRSYWILRGETVSGETIDIPAIEIAAGHHHVPCGDRVEIADGEKRPQQRQKDRQGEYGVFDYEAPLTWRQRVCKFGNYQRFVARLRWPGPIRLRKRR